MSREQEDMRVAPSGYRLVTPPEWVRIPMREGTEETIRAIVDRAFAQLPDDAPQDSVGPYRRELERRLSEAVHDARRAEALDLYLPIERMHGFTVSASIVVSEMAFEDATAADPSSVTRRLMESPGRGGESTSVEVDRAPGVRSERVVPGARGEAEEAEPGSRRVEYVIPVPADPGRWITVVFSTLGAGDPQGALADLFVELFDAMMTTFRWSRA
ncbi:hypothetical protein ACF06I_27855 [Streptomyces albidoflavus]|uniref:hypothetical protein n=1 Tax=Streptomyces sp. 021-3 TaxID=2789259 RepID=UPI0036F6260B